MESNEKNNKKAIITLVVGIGSVALNGVTSSDVLVLNSSAILSSGTGSTSDSFIVTGSEMAL